MCIKHLQSAFYEQIDEIEGCLVSYHDLNQKYIFVHDGQERQMTS